MNTHFHFEVFVLEHLLSDGCYELSDFIEDAEHHVAIEMIHMYKSSEFPDEIGDASRSKMAFPCEEAEMFV